VGATLVSFDKGKQIMYSSRSSKNMKFC